MTPEFTHEEVQGSLLLLESGDLDPLTVANVQRHLDTCDECRREWEMLRNFDQSLAAMDVANALDDQPPPHLDEGDLWLLAAPEAHAELESVRSAWEHALHCGHCCREILRRREALNSPLEPPLGDSSRAAAFVWETIQAQTVAIKMAWVAVGLQIAIRRRRTRTRALTLAAEPSITRPGETWTVERQFGLYKCLVSIVPADFATKTFTISVRLEGPSPARVRLDLQTNGRTVSSGYGGRDALTVSEMPVGGYILLITDEESDELIGSINLAADVAS